MIDELVLQNLVDGELDNAQIRTLLSSVDTETTEGNNAATWKQLAVAYAENQMFQRGFAKFDAAIEATSDDVTSDLSNDSQSLASNQQPNRTGMWWKLALAASLLIGLSIAYQQSRSFMGRQTVSDNSVTDNDEESTSNRLVPASLLNFDHDTLLTLKPDHHLKSGQLPAKISSRMTQQVPLYSVKHFDRQQLKNLQNNNETGRQALFNRLMPATSVNDQMKSDFEKAGLLVDQDVEFLSGRLDDGRAYMIPYRTVRFSSVQ